MTVEIKVTSMVCQACANTVTKAIKSLDAEADIKINLETKIVNINGTPSETEIKEAIAAVGHTVE
ncbi:MULTISPECIES: heavy-metal-associated domain-containing protein [Planktothrix]|jgi:copper chaperone|uniref:HMA domain-containing protein n=2 Tax=Planktothrix TaxID=54304 RepID=A0A4P5ZLT4_PLAAG|nr:MULTISPECIES: heavy-metal-associated domain-containing protein [Planktothrix]CAD5954817.1 Heavy metal transport/detoxification protein [Planktothrix rubescens]MCF3571475.1 heavy-metal-associated domain-containing protein [Planktothrix agardhii 1805]MCF3585633.1 heavy-metal-associated domain-containing protein [Planktothrix agardhii 1803]MCF3602310.1 heavy-metal-associated domain-containing protein [Planktothrix agardhii 1804]MCF3616780.1 heavy-metal-associated domain-containing protein [Pla